MGLNLSSCDRALTEWIASVVDGLSESLGTGHLGTYLHGSLAAGSFYPPKSDVDLLQVVNDPLSMPRREEYWRRCIALHGARPIVGGLECVVVRLEATTASMHPTPYEVLFSESRMAEGLESGDEPRLSPDLVIAFQSIIEGGICLRGRPIDEVFGRVDPDHFRDSMAGDVDWILDRENIVESPFYGVLNLCRALWVWTADSARLAPSKEEAGEWSIRVLPTHQADVVRDALKAYRSSSRVRPEDRKTAGLTWSRTALLQFRDYFRTVRERSASAS